MLHSGQSFRLLSLFFYFSIIFFFSYTDIVLGCQFKLLVESGVHWHSKLLHYFKVIVFLIVITLMLVLFEKGGVSMELFARQFVNVVASYQVSVMAGFQPVP